MTGVIEYLTLLCRACVKIDVSVDMVIYNSATSYLTNRISETSKYSIDLLKGGLVIVKSDTKLNRTISSAAKSLKN